MKRLRIASGLLLALATLAAPAQERDILDAALERPLSTTVNGEPVGFGDPELDNAEIWLRDYLPRPWTATHRSTSWCLRRHLDLVSESHETRTWSCPPPVNTSTFMIEQG